LHRLRYEADSQAIDAVQEVEERLCAAVVSSPAIKFKIDTAGVALHCDARRDAFRVVALAKYANTSG